MRKFYLFLLPLITFFSFSIQLVKAQNIGVSLQADNTGQVVLGGSSFIKLVVSNTSSTTSLANYKIRPFVTIPNFLSFAADGHVLPDGWFIISSDAVSFRVSNGTDKIPNNTQRTILIKVNGNTIGGPLKVIANMAFSSGNVPGTGIGAPTSGNITADDISNIDMEVVNSLPVTLVDFNASLVNCQGLLQWTTRTEINSDRFEIEKTAQPNGHWSFIGNIKAAGNSYREINYSFIDNSISPDATGMFYRLKTVDKDGTFQYSNVIMLANTCRFTRILTYPNPVVNGKLYVNLAEIEGKAEGILINTLGQIAKMQPLVKGLNTIDSRGLSAGIYQLIIRNEYGIVHRANILVQK